MKALDSFTVERLGEIKNAFLDCNKETAPSIGEIFTLIDIALAAKRAEPVSLESAIEKFKEYNIGFPVEKLKADFVISWCLTNLTPQLNSPEIPDYKSALLGLLMSRISKDHLGFFTLAGINKTNLAQAVEVSGETINFDNVPRVDIGECLIPKGWRITPEIPEGWKLTPINPTAEMMAAAMECDDVVFDLDDDTIFCVQFDNIYAAMLAAAPEKPL